ncbi:prevent-host-death family protein [Nocardia sp. GAS34]|uniref:type II toxin-antitoxin system Phd/YefM family antitoxin n=1 Tax=unclassified Nocardia TaxID=2637762 RepID=UPI003D1A8198
MDDDSISIRQLRASLAAVIDKAVAGESTTVTRDGQPVAAIIPMYMLEKLEQWEDEQLTRMADEAEREPGERISLTEMMAEVLDEPKHGAA